ncbi:MAG: indole-3-glycerol phosphate synthase TrpC [Planctomycetes bacterium]|nr:indole-3-glycerol phosphate synthase TrpC [Planctomycetota bacterium]
MILDQIVAHKRIEVARLPPLDRPALRDLSACRGFRAALQRAKSDTVHVIAECKKGSPSRGIFAADYDPVLIAYQYVLGGAHCLSVLTDEKFFYGSLADLEKVRAAVTIPIIRKDFVIDERQIAQARLAGADAVLLIVACLPDGRLRDLHGFARDIGLDVLIEVHDEQEAVRALAVGADLVGVNNRNLKDFSLTLETTFGLLPALLGGGRVVVSESGISTRDDCRRLEQAGVDAVLVGEALMTAQTPEAALKKLRGKLL